MMTWALRPHGVRTRGKKQPEFGGVNTSLSGARKFLSKALGKDR